MGLLKIKEIFNKTKYLLIFLILGIMFLFFLSSLIFDIEIVHSNKEIRELLEIELNNYGIKKYNFKKDYNAIEKIKKEIINNNKEKIEWLEIIESGTKYIVRVEERKIEEKKEEFNYQDIVAKKSSVLKRIEASSGEIIKFKNDYVVKGETVISGSITLPDGSSSLTKAEGKVYGEVWYTVSVSYPYVYREEKLTGRSRELYLIKFLNKRISFFDYNKFKTFNYDEEIIYQNNLLPIKIVKEKQYELDVIDEVNTKKEAIDKGISYAKEKLKKQIGENIEIINEKPLKIVEKESIIEVDVYFSVIEEIGEIKKIEESTVE